MTRVLSTLFWIFVLTVVTTGCSNSWREGDAGRTPEEVAAMLDEVQNGTSGGTGATAVGASNPDVAQVLQLRDSASIYFAEAPGPMGPVGSILSFVDFSFLGMSGLDIHKVKNVRVFFLEAGANFGLIVGIDQGSGLQYVGFTSDQGDFNGDFQALLTGSTGQITVESEDTDGGSLNDVIQLHVFDGQGYVGKFSALVGYTQ